MDSDVLYGSYDKLKHWWYDIMKIIPMSFNSDYDKYPNRSGPKLSFEEQMSRSPDSLYYLTVTQKNKHSDDDIVDINMALTRQKIKLIEE